MSLKPEIRRLLEEAWYCGRRSAVDLPSGVATVPELEARWRSDIDALLAHGEPPPTEARPCPRHAKGLTCELCDTPAAPPPADQQPEVCICEIDKHDFNCPVHNDFAPESRMHHE